MYECESCKCGICGKEAILSRKYYYYPIKCECHSPCHFELVCHCSTCTPVEPKETRVLFKTEDLRNPVPMAMGIIKDALREDKSPGSWYYSWQSNIACDIMDNSDLNHDKANDIAVKFLERLLRD